MNPGGFTLGLLAGLGAAAAACALQTPCAFAAPSMSTPATSTVPQVSVSVGQPLQQKSAAYGAAEIDRLSHDLARIVGERLDRSHAADAPVKVALVLEDATPNHPTLAELGDNAGLSLGSVGLGGAWIDGTATLADGRKVPIGFSFYETNLDQEFGAATWFDATRAFDALAAQLAKGAIPSQAAPSAPAPVAFAHWPPR